MGIFDGRVALVTGAGAGLGAAYSELLASQGARVVLNDFGREWFGEQSERSKVDTVVDRIVASGGEAVADHGDCGSWDDAAAMVQCAIDTFGKLDILICNAGIMRLGSVAALSQKDWNDVIHVHLGGTFAPAHFAARHWRERAGAGEDLSSCRVVTTTSAAAICFSTTASGDGWWSAAYAAAKAGIIGFTLTLAGELHEFGIAVNAVLPGSTHHPGRPGAEPNPEIQKRMVPERVAPIVGFLASSCVQVTGQVFHAVGGRIDCLTLPRLRAGGYKDGEWSAEELAPVIESLRLPMNPYPLEDYYAEMMRPIQVAAGIHAV
jgi:NAD(P)-dependent dehydrogenase (short-subunit alcohol dehydrogenase family)